MKQANEITGGGVLKAVPARRTTNGGGKDGPLILGETQYSPATKPKRCTMLRLLPLSCVKRVKCRENEHAVVGSTDTNTPTRGTTGMKTAITQLKLNRQLIPSDVVSRVDYRDTVTNNLLNLSCATARTGEIELRGFDFNAGR